MSDLTGAVVAGGLVGLLAGVVAATCLRAALLLSPGSVRGTAGGIVAVGAVGTIVAAGSLPAAGLLLIPVVPIAVAYLALGVAGAVAPARSVARPAVVVCLAALVGVAGLLLRGAIGSGPEYVGHVLRPPSLVLSSVALSLTALAGFPLGVAAVRGAAWRWIAALGLVVLPVATVLAVGLRTWALTGRFVPGVLSVVAVLLSVPAFRLGHAVAARNPEPGSDEREDATGGEASAPVFQYAGRED